MRSPINRHSIWQIAVDAALVALAWWLAWILRFDQARPVYYDRYLDWHDRRARRRDQAPGLRALAASTTAGGATSRRATCGRRSAASCSPRSQSSSSSRSSTSTGSRVPRGVWFIDLLLCLALRRRLSAARADDDRAPAAGPDRGARQGGRRRRRGRRRAARRQGDAAQPGARLHADRAARRRPAQAEPAPPRRPRARDDRRSRPRRSAIGDRTRC